MTDKRIEQLVRELGRAAHDIRRELGDRSRHDEENPSGERQYEVDVRADDLLFERFRTLSSVGTYASEERATPEDCGDGYRITVDPLDGSSNLHSNNCVGTILGVYTGSLPARGRDLVAAAYVLYGPITTLVVASNGSVTEYIVEEDGIDIREEHVTIPPIPTVYGFGGRVPEWTTAFTEYVREVERELKVRYSGAMVADVNQILAYGGIFSYPALESAPLGKIRLQFEANPLAYVIESAGGRSSNGRMSILDVDPNEIHQRTPVHLGNEQLIDRLEKTLS